MSLQTAQGHCTAAIQVDITAGQRKQGQPLPTRQWAAAEAPSLQHRRPRTSHQPPSGQGLPHAVGFLLTAHSASRTAASQTHVREQGHPKHVSSANTLQGSASTTQQTTCPRSLTVVHAHCAQSHVTLDFAQSLVASFAAQGATTCASPSALTQHLKQVHSRPHAASDSAWACIARQN